LWHAEDASKTHAAATTAHVRNRSARKAHHLGHVGPAGPALRNVTAASLSAKVLYSDVRHTSPERLPRSPVIGTDAPVQYEQREDIGRPRKRMPARNP